MRHATPSPRPPQFAAWLVSLFGPSQQVESILGDLAEELSDIASKSGVASARSWYWRQSLKTSAHLASSSFRTTPWSLGGVVLLGFLLRRIDLQLPERIIVAILRAQRPYSNLHYGFYVWQITYGIPIAHIMVSALVGCVVAFAAKGREIVATVTLSLLVCGLIGAALVRVATLGPMDFAWMLWSFADPLTMVFGGVIVRQIRLGLARRLSRT